MSVCYLLALPDELLLACLPFIAVDDLLSCALTCKELYGYLQDDLRKQSEYHPAYQILHDRLPLTVPTLLRLALNSSDEIWHLRSFDSWGLRPGFHKWKTWESSYAYSHDEPPDDWPEPAEDHSHLDDNFFLPDELATFRSIMTETLRLSTSEVEEWLGNVRQGFDEPLKGMLFAMAPHLDRLNFIAYDSWQGDQFHNNHPFTFLSLSIRRIYDSLSFGVKWPQGFASLRQVSVCTSTDLRHPHDAFYAEPSAVAPLFLLPNIKILNFVLLGYVDDPNFEFELDERSSTVEDLSFNCCDIPTQAWSKFLRAPRRLVRFTCMSSSSEADPEICTILGDQHSQTLEHLSWDTHLTSPATLYQKSTKLRSLECVSIVTSEELKHEALLATEMHALLPPTIETLQLITNTRPPDSSLDLLSIIRAVAGLTQNPRFKGLQTVCLWSLSPRIKSREDDEDSAYWSTARSIMASGIDLHLHPNGTTYHYSEHAKLHHDGSEPKGGTETYPTRDDRA